ncbi:MAG: MCE family protein [Bacteroidetes bacterium]|nr:MCE family protein [Bacteroidota bacterium]
MKVSNETKIGALAAVSIALLILGFNFLKGKNLFEKKATMYITFTKVEGLNVADGIKINGLRVGSVESLDEQDADVTGVVVAFQLTRGINIPKDSYGTISAVPLGSTYINITLGSSASFLADGDTLKGVDSKSMIDDLQARIEPTMENVNKALVSLDSTIRKVNATLDEQAQQHIATALREIAQTTQRINGLLEPGKGALAKSLDHVESVAGNIRDNNDSIDKIIGNLNKVSRQLASSDLSGVVESLDESINQLNVLLKNINEGKGSLGKLANDETLYKQLNSTTNSLNILLQDLRLHPKRYINVSVFGKKDKSGPLMNALPDSATNR